MVFQRFNLFPHMTALTNVMEAPMRVRKMNKSPADAWARTLLSRGGVQDKAGAYPAQRAGGRQRPAAIARATAIAPRAFATFCSPGIVRIPRG